MPARPTPTARGIAGVAVALWILAAVLPVLGGCDRGEPQGVPARGDVSKRPASVQTETPQPPAAAYTSTPITFAVIGDYGTDDRNAAAVARLVASWNPRFVITTGDDYYSVAGGTGTGRYDESTGAHYARWLADITTTGTRAPVGKARVNAFFPALGNHDYTDALPAPRTYLTYFELPGRRYVSSSGNERYYDYAIGPAHFFVLNSNPQERHGTAASSRQAQWLKRSLAASTARFNVVYGHHPPYSSDAKHGSTRGMRWPYAKWGADVVISGHSHTYERVERDGIVYIVNGLGGAKRYAFGTPVGGSKARYSRNWGAQRVTLTPSAMKFEFFTVSGRLVDTRVVRPSP